MKLLLTDFDSNTYMDTDGSCDMCMSTGMYDHPVYTFTDSYGGKHVIEGWWSEWGFLYSYDVNVPVFTYWLHDVEFKEPDELKSYDYLTNEKSWEKFLKDILDSASDCSSNDSLNENLAWALKD